MPEFVEHTIEPIYDHNSQVLILGTMPSPKSREAGFYYSHPQNRFWRVIAEVFNQEKPVTNEDKKAFLIRNHIAMWDVLKNCSIEGAADSSIKNPQVNDINFILSHTRVKTIFTTGGKASALYKRFCYPDTRLEAISLPSTSPANAGCRYDDLVKAYRCILEVIDNRG